MTGSRAADDTLPVDREALLVVPSSLLDDAEAAIEQSAEICRGVLLARDMVNTPPGHGTPDGLTAMVDAAMPDTVEVEVHGMDWLRGELLRRTPAGRSRLGNRSVSRGVDLHTG